MESTQGPRVLREVDPRQVAWRRMVAEREEQARDLIRAHPVVTLLGAAAVGFGLARLLRSER